MSRCVQTRRRKLMISLTYHILMHYQCFGTYDDSKFQGTNLTDIWRLWTFQVCTEWGYFIVCMVIYPFPQGLIELCSPHRQTQNGQALYRVSLMSIMRQRYAYRSVIKSLYPRLVIHVSVGFPSWRAYASTTLAGCHVGERSWRFWHQLPKTCHYRWRD
jgi:hypothetical protein